MKKCVWKILIICLCCMVQGVEAQTGKVYTTDMGLSSSLINQIFQDQQGFVWVATEYGLNKFDGVLPIIGMFRQTLLLSKVTMYVHCLRIAVAICW